MLPRKHRLRLRSDFADVLRHGRRASRPLLTVVLTTASTPSDLPPRAGLVVNKAVGDSVVRSQVARRLRHQLQALIADVPPGSRMVVRASPAAATATSAALGHDLRAALKRVGR